MCGHPFVPIQILTGDTRKGCYTRHSRLLDERWSLPQKPCIEQSFESSPESRGSQTSGVLPVLFVQAKRIKLFPFGKFRGSANLDSARRNGGFAQTKLKPSKKELRGSANLDHAFRFSRSRKSASVLRFTSKLKSTSASSTHTLTPTAYNAQTNRLSAAITST